MYNQLMWCSGVLSFDAKIAQGIAVPSGFLALVFLGIATHPSDGHALPMRARSISVPILRGDPPIFKE